MKIRLFRWVAPSAGMSALVICSLANHLSLSTYAQEISVAYAQEELASLTTLEQEGITVLQSGPLHEAFAEQFGMEPEKPLTVKREPPQAIEELPPAYQPDGENVVWIPGYWGWDVGAQEYLWISGVWRNVPPYQSWVPGYWSRTSDGWVWVSGFWLDENAPEQVEYLPTPPPTLDHGPSVKPTVENQVWIPGQWVFVDNDYAWQAGYWADGIDGWVWVPARYVWTPMGYIYRAGYWDYELTERGIVFCPIAVSQTRQIRQYRPQHIVDLGPAFLANLFVVPRYNHYYYGSYYGYQGNAIVPWVTYGRQAQYYDPIFASYAYNGSRVNTLRQIIQLQRYISTNQSIQPTRTLVSQARLINDVSQNLRPYVLRAAAIESIAQAPQQLGFDVALQAIPQDSVQQLASGIRDWRQAATARADLERPQNDDDRQRAEIQADASGNRSPRTNAIRPRRAQFLRPQMTNVLGGDADRSNRLATGQERRQDRRQDANNPTNTGDDNNLQPNDAANAGRTPTPASPEQTQSDGRDATNMPPDRPQSPTDRPNSGNDADDGTPLDNVRPPRQPRPDRPTDPNNPPTPENRSRPEVANDANAPDALDPNRNPNDREANGLPPRPNRGRGDAQRMTPEELQRRYEELRQSRERGGNARSFGNLDTPNDNPNTPQSNAAQPPDMNELRQQMQRRLQQNQRRNPDAAAGQGRPNDPAAGNQDETNRRRPGRPNIGDQPNLPGNASPSTPGNSGRGRGVGNGNGGPRSSGSGGQPNPRSERSPSTEPATPNPTPPVTPSTPGSGTSPGASGGSGATGGSGSEASGGSGSEASGGSGTSEGNP